MRIYYQRRKGEYTHFTWWLQSLRAILLLVLLPAVVSAEEKMQSSQLIELDLKEVSLKVALKTIERQTNYHFVVNESLIHSEQQTVTLIIKSDNIEEVLNRLLAGTNLSYRIRKHQVTLIPPQEKAEINSPFLAMGSSSLVALDKQQVYQP